MGWKDSSASIGILRRRSSNDDNILPTHRDIKAGGKFQANGILIYFGFIFVFIFLLAIVLLSFPSHKARQDKLFNVNEKSSGAQKDRVTNTVKYESEDFESNSIDSKTKLSAHEYDSRHRPKNYHEKPKVGKLIQTESKSAASVPNDSLNVGASTLVGNIVLLSYRINTESSNVANLLANNFGFHSGFPIFSRRFWDEGLRLPPIESSASLSPASTQQRARMEAYIKARLRSADGGVVRRLVEVEVGDAWGNGVSVSWLLNALRVYGGVTHAVLLSRNSIRLQLWSEGMERFDGAYPTMTCEQLKQLFEIDAHTAVNLAVFQSRAFAEAAVVSSLPQLGLSYEADFIKSDASSAVSQVANLLGLTPRAGADRMVPPTRQCPLSEQLHNYPMLQCMLAGSPLSWIVQDVENSEQLAALNFRDGLEAVKEYHRSWEMEQPLVATRCKAQLQEKDARNLEQVPVDVVKGRCAHGGHSEGCRGHGAVSEFVCKKIFESSSCDVMTYTAAGECYMHSSDKDDFWIGECVAPAYYATLKGPRGSKQS